METLKDAIDVAGGVQAVAQANDLTERAIYKWIKKDALPRSEYTGETAYSQQIAALSKGKLTKEQILKIGRPTKTTT